MEVPEFARGSPLLEGAFRMAEHAHSGPRHEAETGLGHPVRVAELLSAQGFDETIVAAALLHEVIEETATDAGEVEERFGPEVARLVAAMTEDERIEPYAERKAEHRARAARDRSVAAIYAADKLAKTEDLLAHNPYSAPEPRLDHYMSTLRELGDTYPDLPFLGELHRELELIGEERRGDR
ncbi:MAG: HD domain-containing protein [Solirubrobacterales bacterium]